MIESFSVVELVETTFATAVVAVLAMTVTAVISRRIGKVGIVDITWGIGLTAIAVVCAVLGGDRRGWLLVGLVAVWGCACRGTCSGAPVARARTRAT